MIVITGATGQLGRAVVEQLLQTVAADAIGVSVRDPAKAEDLARRGVRVRRGDFDDAEALRSAFEGASQVLLVSSNAAARGGDPIAQHHTALAAATAAGARRVLYTSHMGASPTSPFPPCVGHAATEAMLRATGVPFTALRNGFYASTLEWILAAAWKSGELVAPEDGKVSWTAHADLAAAIARILADEGRFDGPTPPLTGAEALDLADVAAIASDLTGRPIRRVTASDDAFRTGMLARGVPGPAVDITVGMYQASRTGAFAAANPTLGQLIGRPPTPVRDVLAAWIARVN